MCYLLEVDETTLKVISSSIDEALSLIEGNKDIRIISARLPKVANTIRAMAEINDTPDNRFAQFLVTHFLYDFSLRFASKEEEWYKLNKESVDQCILHLKNLLTGLQSSFNSKSFEKTIDTIKMFFFAYYQATSGLSV